MTTDSDRVKDIFDEAIEISSKQKREEFLGRACSEDQKLRRQVEDYLEAHEAAGSFLESGVLGEQPTSPFNSAPERPGTVIGRYKLLQRIGEGGFGVVYMAEQKEPVRRKVAIKIIKPGMDTREVIARFEAERQALAMMDHPSIAKVLDAGTTDAGRPYFVMELVKGVPVTEYCDEQQLTLRERLTLFIVICKAVQHAHQKGIIHRDLKPSNVLVADFDDEPVPKIIDFGVAKALNQELTEKTLFTRYGEIVGTIHYMSPEQARFNQRDIDTRSDIYSLGVLLYELLTGETPFDKKRLRSAAFDELIRIIREEDPPKPSTRLSSSHTLASVAAKRKTAPARLSTLIRGDLDWIVMKALEKDRLRRYETANGLAADVRRLINGDMVEARPPTAGYRFKKLVARNKGSFAAAVTLLIAIVIAGVGLVFGWFNAQLSLAKTTDALKQMNIAFDEKNVAVKRESAQRFRAERANYALLSDLAFLALHESNRGALEHLLSEMARVPSMHGFEYRFLRQRMQHLTVPELEIGDKVTAVAFGDNHTVVVGRIDGLVQSFKSDHRIQPLPDDVRGTNVAVSPDGKLLAAGGMDNPLRLFNLKSFAEVDLSEEKIHTLALTFSADGHHLAYVTKSGILEVFDLVKKQRRRMPDQISAISNPFANLSISLTGRYIAASQERAAVVWDRETNHVLRLPSESSWFNCLQFGHDDSLLAGSEFKLRKFDLAGGKVLERHSRDLDLAATCIALSRDGKTVAIGCADYTVWIGNFETLEEYARLPHRNYLVSLAFSSDGASLAAGGRGGTVLLWKKDAWSDASDWAAVRNHEPAIAIDRERDECLSVRLSKDKDHYEVVATNLRTLNQEVIVEHDTVFGVISALAISPDGSIATGSGDGQIRLWSRSGISLEPLVAWQAHSTLTTIAFQVLTHVISDLEFSEDGAYLFSSGKRPGIAKWNIKDRRDGEAPERLVVFDAPDSWVSDIDVSEEWGLLVAAGGYKPRSGFTCIWKLSDLSSPTHSFQHTEWNRRVELSPSGKLVACQEDFSAGQISLIDLASQQSVVDLTGHSSKTVALAYDPTGKRIVTGSDDGTIRIWDAQSGTGSLVGTIRVGKRIRRLEFADPYTLVSASWEGTVQVWEAPPVR